ncbi:MAG TPA: site-2 protease family protein [Solirubrobacteraceae bacterium]|nr:site-2 protease family protein [Solirubrobacteraceae bacterium]
MPGRSIRIARIAGIPVGVSPWWLVIVALITWSLGASYFPEVVHGIRPGVSYALGLASALLLFASILAHEFGHALVARRHGIEVEEIDLWLLGGVSRMRNEAHAPGDELRYALAGPAVTAAIAAVFGVALALLPSSTPEVVRALVEYQLLVNGLILVFNLLPAFPLDGGRVLRSALWRRSGEIGRSTQTAARVGRGFGYLMVFLGALEFVGGAPEGLWLALIGFFVVIASGQQAMGAQVQAAFANVRARDLMSSPVVSIPARTSAERAGADYFLPYRYTAFPVVDEQGRALGLVSVGDIETLPREQRAARRVAEIAARDPQLIVGEDDDVARLLERPAFARVGRAVVVDERSRPVGLISITDVQRALRVSRLTQHVPSDAAFPGSRRREPADDPAKTAR